VARIGDDRFQFCAAPGFRTDKRMMVNEFFESFTSAEQAKATKQEDRQAILGAINHHFGSTATADSFIKDLMRRGMAHCWFELYPENREDA
jgi:hypothetical protein